jgi:hypothetical protein
VLSAGIPLPSTFIFVHVLKTSAIMRSRGSLYFRVSQSLSPKLKRWESVIAALLVQAPAVDLKRCWARVSEQHRFNRVSFYHPGDHSLIAEAFSSRRLINPSLTLSNISDWHRTHFTLVDRKSPFKKMLKKLQSQRLNKQSRAEGAGLDNMQVRRLSSFVRFHAEMRNGEHFVMRELRSRGPMVGRTTHCNIRTRFIPEISDAPKRFRLFYRVCKPLEL